MKDRPVISYMTHGLSKRGTLERSLIDSSRSARARSLELGGMGTGEVGCLCPGVVARRPVLVVPSQLVLSAKATSKEWAVATRRDDRWATFIPALCFRPAIGVRGWGRPTYWTAQHLRTPATRSFTG